MNFRYDINGLRAIAVLAVVVFHFNPQWLPGGFTGVDVFFVISGFLMTSIIFSGVEKNTFNLFKFYNARANRIVPVLAAMSTVLLVFGWFYLIPTDYSDLGRQVEKSSLFISNLLFAKGGGYFDTAEHTKWLLHTWSLSVEWQFYIFFPIVIIALKKYLSVSNLKRVVLGLFLASFIYCIYATYKDSKTAYFLLTSRAWEMLLGGLAFLYPWSLKNKLHQIFTQCLGIILIVASYFLMSKDTPWPGYMALIPVLGAYFMVVANYQNNFLINNPISNSIGKWSYSIYVWHWPLVVLGFYFTFEDWWIYGIPLSILLGFLSYQFIEKINFSRYSSWKEIYKIKPFYIFLIILACGYAVKENDGFKWHYTPEVQKIISEIGNRNSYHCDLRVNETKFEECIIGNTQNIKALIIGDSHADVITTSITNLFNLKNDGIVVMSTGGCPVLSNSAFINENCRTLNNRRLAIIKSKKYADIPIILASRYALYLEGENSLEMMEPNSTHIKKPYGLFEQDMKNTICKYSAHNPVFILQPIPDYQDNIPKLMAKKAITNQQVEESAPLSDYISRQGKIRNVIQKTALSCGTEIIDPKDTLCTEEKCVYAIDEKPIYTDANHLSEYGNKFLTPLFKDALNP
jgi:peptidoglycan/LPS O-acetylase OafA/YrhL